MLKLTFREAQGAAHQVATTTPAHLQSSHWSICVPTMTVCLRDVSLGSHTNIDPTRNSHLSWRSLVISYPHVPKTLLWDSPIIGNSLRVPSPHWPVPSPPPPAPCRLLQLNRLILAPACPFPLWAGGRKGKMKGGRQSLPEMWRALVPFSHRYLLFCFC